MSEMKIDVTTAATRYGVTNTAYVVHPLVGRNIVVEILLMQSPGLFIAFDEIRAGEGVFLLSADANLPLASVMIAEVLTYWEARLCVSA